MSKPTRLLRSCLHLIALAGSLLLGAPRADAGYLLPFTGNTFPVNGGPGVAGHVNFIVLDHTGGVAGDTFGTGIAGFDSHFIAGTGSGPLDTAAQFLYLFQTVNDGANLLTISANSVQVMSASVTSHGFFRGTSFSNNGVATSAGGPYLGPFPGISAPPGDPSGHVVGGLPGVILSGSGLGPTTTLLGAGSVSALYPGGLTQGAISNIWGYTTNLAPLFVGTSIQDSGTSAQGSVPGQLQDSPEPSSRVLAGIGALGLFGYGICRRRGA
jgi:hypothetical protein